MPQQAISTEAFEKLKTIANFLKNISRGNEAAQKYTEVHSDVRSSFVKKSLILIGRETPIETSTNPFDTKPKRKTVTFLFIYLFIFFCFGLVWFVL